jgi:hemin uptake protein HemP
MNSSKQPNLTRPVAPCQATVVHSQQLLAGQRLIVIEHHGERYVLRETNQGKLILTK